MGAVDVRDINLDTAVKFEDKMICVDVGASHPLNRPARITIEGIYVPDGRDGARYKAKLQKAAERAGGKFVDYLPTDGKWLFDVNHFVTNAAA